MIEIYQIKTEYEHYKISISSYYFYMKEFYPSKHNEQEKKDLYIRIAENGTVYWIKMPKKLFNQKESDEKIFHEALGSIINNLEGKTIKMIKNMEFDEAVNSFQGRDWL